MNLYLIRYYEAAHVHRVALVAAHSLIEARHLLYDSALFWRVASPYADESTVVAYDLSRAGAALAATAGATGIHVSTDLSGGTITANTAETNADGAAFANLSSRRASYPADARKPCAFVSVATS